LCPGCLLDAGLATARDEAKPGVGFTAPSIDDIARLFPQLEQIAHLGTGGMGAVYKAYQCTLDRWVALKVLPATDDGSDRAAERFNREARALARLQHPHIVAVHEFGRAGHLHYFLMEYVDGVNLRQLERSSRLSPREALRIIPQICDALQYAHDAGVVHRDIKPENVLIDRQGRVKIADFGLAKLAGQEHSETRLTLEGQVMGTPHYMAPEQVERPLAVDHRADIYSLGVVFYEMLTGDLPLGKFPPPSRKVEVDVRLDEIVLRALENDPGRRYQKAGEVKVEIQTVMESKPEVRTTREPEKTGESADAPRYLRWAGFPVVVQRGDEREVYAEGAIGVAFVMAITTTLAQQAIRWTTGKDYSMPQLSFAIALMTTLFVIRRTMNRPWDLPKVESGPTKLWKRLPWSEGALVAGLIVLIVALHFVKVWVLNPWQERRAAGRLVQQNVVVSTTTPQPTAVLPGGGQIQLIGLVESGAAPNQWWRPDGTPLENTYMELHDAVAPTGDAGRRAVYAVIRSQEVPQEVEGPFFAVLPDGSTGSGGQVVLNGVPRSDLSPAVFSWEQPYRKADLLVGMAIQPWRTISSHDRNRHRTVSETRVGDPHWEIQVHGIVETGEGVQATILTPRERQDWKSRVIAVDATGQEHTHRMAAGSGTPGNTGTVWTYTFQRLSIAQLQEIRVQVRPIHWLAFRDVELRPTGKLPSPEPMRFGAVEEREVRELIDFDTGRTGDFPSVSKGEHPLAGIGDAVLWAQRNGFDVAVSTGELTNLGTEFSNVRSNEWVTLSPQQVIDRVYQEPFHPEALTARTMQPLPATYAYRTREGGYGLVQVVTFDLERPRVMLRLKPVVRPGLATTGTATTSRR